VEDGDGDEGERRERGRAPGANLPAGDGEGVAGGDAGRRKGETAKDRLEIADVATNEIERRCQKHERGAGPIDGDQGAGRSRRATDPATDEDGEVASDGAREDMSDGDVLEQLVLCYPAALIAQLTLELGVERLPEAGGADDEHDAERLKERRTLLVGIGGCHSDMPLGSF
jgi:hypothetical protein